MSSNLLIRFAKADWKLQYVLIALLGAVLFLPFIGHIHLFDWDEANFAEISREMLVTGEYFKVQIDYQPFYEKPPLFAWIQYFSYRLWGINEFAARFPNVIVGITCLLLLFYLGKKIKNTQFGLIWTFCYAGSLLPFFFFKTGLIDPIFNLLIFSSIVYFVFLINGEKSNWHQFLKAGMLNGLAILAKGPVAILIFFLVAACYWIFIHKRLRFISLKASLSFAVGVFIVSSLWFIPETIIRGPIFIKEFISYMVGLLSRDIASHAQPFYYHLIVIFIGCFPISIFALKNIIKTKEEKYDFNRWMICLFWVVLILFSLVKTKIINYSSLTYYPLSYLAAYSLYQYQKIREMKRSLFFLIMGVLLSIIPLAFPILFNNPEFIELIFKNDQFSRIAFSSVHFSELTILIALIWLIGIIITFIQFRRKKLITALSVYLVSVGLFLNSTLFWVIPTIESALQGPAIEYFKKLKSQEVYVGTLGFKSYAGYFYTNRIPELSGYSDKALLTEYIDKDCYLIVKPRRLKLMQQYPKYSLIEQNGGYYLFFRPKTDQ